MFNNLTAESITALPINHRESTNFNRSLRGCHVYVSRWYDAFRKLSNNEQLQIRNNNNNVNQTTAHPTNLPDDYSINSFDSFNQDNSRVSTEQRRQLVWYEWQGYSQEIKAAWEARADNLNGREVPGLLLQYPAALGSNSLSIQEAVLKSMSNEWRGFVLKIHRLLKKIPARTNRIWHVRFGNEEVEIRMQKYKTFEFSYLLLLTLFGANFTNLPQCYIVSNTKRQVVIHIDAMEAVRNMFEIKALSAFEVRYEQDVNTMSNDQIIVRTTAGKLTLKRRNTNQQAVGYILRVNGMKWNVMLPRQSSA